MPDDKLIVKGARVHNLKNIDVEMPRDQLIVITGLSGSGKSSLAFDTIYAEGQRRYVESLSAYARQFLGLMERPDVDYIEGLSPSISIEQKTVSHNPRSTVGTVTEIYDYLRLLFARVGTQFCYNCGRKVQRQTVDQIIDSILQYPAGAKLQILAPVVKGRKGHYRELFEQILKDGFVRVRIDGEVKQIVEGLKTDRYKIHNIEIVVDRIAVKKDIRARIAESVEVALRYGNGVLIVNDGTKDQLYSRYYSCNVCEISYEEPAPNSFSFNTPAGSCPECEGLGEKKAFDLRLIIPDESLSINQEGLAPFGKPKPTWIFSQLKAVAKRYDFDFDTPIKKLPAKVKQALFHGAGDEKFDVEYSHSSGKVTTYKHRFGGVLEMLRRYYEEATTNNIREWVESFMATTQCPVCQGGRLKQESLAMKLEDAKTGKLSNIHDIVSLSIRSGRAFFDVLSLSPRQMEIGRQVLKEITQRLDFLLNVGLDYLTLDRSARTLSGGEGQRIRLATQIGTQLVGVLYILDEPSIGLHQRDNIKLINSLKTLRDLGNTIVVVEHDKETIQSADYVIDLGPGAGEHGGYVVTVGKPGQLKIKNVRQRRISPRLKKLRSKGNGYDGTSLTALYLQNKKHIEIPKQRRKENGSHLVLKETTGNNLKNVTLQMPLGMFVCITGVSGSGKSTLINETLYPILSNKFYRTRMVSLPYKSIHGLEHIDKVIDIDQSPIGRTPRSNPATYTGLFTLIRDLFTQLPESKIRGYKAGRFSFNVKGGRCEGCEGDGVKRIEMNFLPDVYVLCDVCNGKRYNRETLEVRYKGKSISDVLEMTVEDAIELFSELPRLQRHLQTLHDVGLGYIRLGQQATTLSGGEAQRVKLSTELAKIGTGKTMYILDEPTTGLHFEDIRMLLSVLNKLVDKGNTVIVIEHNLDVIKTADWVIDLGPEGGDAGGEIIAEGTPEEVAKNAKSHTGLYLKKELSNILK
ncbi:MAG: excinuclease ABC subunit UvrA [Ignavibacteriales bacterium]|nr:excinuclease ABC subunit UvrA [Ignavibacteriales bacterium]